MITVRTLVKSKKVWITIVVLLIVSPIFGVTLADMVGYHEPLDLAAEAVGLRDVSEEVTWTPFYDYKVPGLPDEVGYIVSGAIGVLAVVAIGYGILKLSEKRRRV